MTARDNARRHMKGKARFQFKQLRASRAAKYGGLLEGRGSGKGSHDGKGVSVEGQKERWFWKGGRGQGRANVKRVERVLLE